jgi:hypothetical protein
LRPLQSFAPQRSSDSGRVLKRQSTFAVMRATIFGRRQNISLLRATRRLLRSRCGSSWRQNLDLEDSGFRQLLLRWGTNRSIANVVLIRKRTGPDRLEWVSTPASRIGRHRAERSASAVAIVVNAYTKTTCADRLGVGQWALSKSQQTCIRPLMTRATYYCPCPSCSRTESGQADLRAARFNSKGSRAERLVNFIETTLFWIARKRNEPIQVGIDFGQRSASSTSFGPRITTYRALG